MNYLEWNNLIGQHFFNTANAGKDVYLYITKNEIIELAGNSLPATSPEEIWSDFIKAIKKGIPGSAQLSLIDKSIYALKKSQDRVLRIEGTEILRPAYITYLTFFVLPLIEHQGEFTTSNYYGRLKEYLRIHGIDDSGIETLTFQKMNHLWEDLSAWANIVNHKDLGSFTIKPFTNSRWVYVGKPFSQCIFPPKSIKRLPEFFLAADMIPDSIYDSAEMKRNLLHHGSNVLSLSKNAIESIKASDANELGQSIIEKALQEYKKWSGESHSLDESNANTKRNLTTARIYLQFQLFTNAGRIEFSFRMRYRDEFPEDLNFNGVEIREEKGGYSRTINLPFKETFLLKDDFTKWVAKFPDKEVRLFVSAGSLQFSTDYWIETDTLSKVNWMYLFCKNTKREKILGWLKSHCTKFEDESDYSEMPIGYSLFRFLNPKEGLAEIPELTIIKDKSIQLVSALKLDFRTFTDDFLPEVEIINSDGTESMYLQYKNSEERIPLKRKISSTNRWLLPEDISQYTDFNVRVEGETFKENETSYKIVSSNDSTRHLNGNSLPKRNSFGRATYSEISAYSIGSNTVGLNLSRQIPYQHIFRGTKEDAPTSIYEPVYEQSQGNLLLSFLTLKETISAKDFFVAFELIHGKYLGNKSNSGNVNYSIIKKAALNFLDYLGFLDYEYQTEKIVVNPPQLIFIPTNKGRKVLLIGGRDLSFVNTIIATAPKYNLQVEITKQFQSNEDMLLPDALTIKSFGKSHEGFGEANLISFAKELNIRFNPNDLVQIGLQHFCSDLDNYETDLYTNSETLQTYEDWARYIFNHETLKLDKSQSINFDKSFSLLEYRLRPWEFHYRLWKNNKCYDVDRNWGKYIALKHFTKHVILYDRTKQKVAVPVGAPLPRLLAESIMLLSGLAPQFANLDGKPYRVYENIPSVFIQNLFDKLKQKINERNI